MVIYSNEIIGYINFFEKKTRTHVKDCFLENDSLVFIVNQGELGKALGKNAINVKKLGLLFKKRLKIIEFNSNPKRFILNLIYPIKTEVIEEDGKIKIQTTNSKEKGKIYGRDRSNFRRIKKIFSKFFEQEVIIE